MKRLFWVLFLVAVSTCALAADFGLRIISYPKKVIQGEPMWITAEISNVSGHSITVCTGGSNSFVYALEVRRADGRQRQGCPQPPLVKLAPHYGTKELPADWKDVIRRDLSCRYAAKANQTEEPGDLIVEFYLVSGAPCPKADSQGNVVGEYKAWTGSISAPEVHISLCKPSGVDKEAYDYFKGFPLGHRDELLQRFPASIYAGYVLIKNGPGGSILAASCITPQKRDQIWYVPTGASIEKQNERREKIRKCYEDFINQAQTFLNVHTEFSQEALLRKELSIALFFLDRPDEAWKEVDKLSKLNGRWAEEAKAVLRHKKEKEKTFPDKDKK